MKSNRSGRPTAGPPSRRVSARVNRLRASIERTLRRIIPLDKWCEMQHRSEADKDLYRRIVEEYRTIIWDCDNGFGALYFKKGFGNGDFDLIQARDQARMSRQKS